MNCNAAGRITLTIALLTIPSMLRAQSACETVTRYGIPSPSTITTSAAAMQSAVVWLRQFRNYDDARAAVAALSVNLPAILAIEFQDDSTGWTKLRESLDTFDAKPAAVVQRYQDVMQQVHAATARQLASCLAQPGLKVWVEYVSERDFAVAARFDRKGGRDRLTIDRFVHDSTVLLCDGALTQRERVGLVPRRIRPIDATGRREICQRRTLDEARIFIAAAEDPVGGAVLRIPSFEPLSVVSVVVPSSTRNYSPPHTRGDREYGGVGTNIRVHAWLETDASRQRLYIRFDMNAEESGGDKTTSNGTSPMTEEFLVHAAPQGFEIIAYPVARDTVEARTESTTPIGVQAGAIWDKFQLGGIVATKHGIIDVWEVSGRTIGPGTWVKASSLSVLVKLRRINSG
jgi:hypothetical protein